MNTFSLWEKQSFLNSDILIVGSGISGLSAAATLKERNPQLSVTVLERGVLPTGASTKNAGFACFGSVSELLNDIATIGEEAMVKLVERRWNGLQKTMQRLGKETIDLQMKSGFELIDTKSLATIEQIQHINSLLLPLFDRQVFHLADEKIGSFGFGETQHLIENTSEGQLDTGKLILSLWNYCARLGVRVHTGCEVTDIQEEGDVVIISTKEADFKAKKVGVCTNAFTNKLLPKEQDIAPGRGIVMSIISEKPLKFEGTFHYQDGYYYFRDYYGKLLFGGGRNLALKEEETTEFGINGLIKKKLIADLDQIILLVLRITSYNVCYTKLSSATLLRRLIIRCI